MFTEQYSPDICNHAKQKSHLNPHLFSVSVMNNKLNVITIIILGW